MDALIAQPLLQLTFKTARRLPQPTFETARIAFVRATRALRASADALIALLLAPECAVCERLLDRPTRGCVCPACWAAVPLLTPPVCARCGDALASLRADDECARCRRSAPAIDVGRAAGLYDGPLRHIVHAFKFRGRRSLATPLARLMRAHAGELLIGIDWAVPVPLHRTRARRRGFNQAEDLARALGPPVLHALRRVRDTRPQTGLPAARRHRNVRDAFALARWCAPRRRGARVSFALAVAPAPGRTLLAAVAEARFSARTLMAAFVRPPGPRPGRSAVAHRLRARRARPRGAKWWNVLREGAGPGALLAGRCVLLVDDVATTGATLNACARVLKAAGAREVRALTAARAVRTPRAESPPTPPRAAARRR